MKAFKFSVVATCCVLLAACAAPLKPEDYQPANADFYKTFPKSYLLKGKVAVGKVTSDLPPDDPVTASAFQPALTRVLAQAGLLATKGRAPYVLAARIVDYRWPDSGFTEVTGGATVAYLLVDAKTGKRVYNKSVVSTKTQPKGVLEDTESVMWRSAGTALGENAVQLARELTRIKALKVVAPEDMPLRRLEGAE